MVKKTDFEKGSISSFIGPVNLISMSNLLCDQINTAEREISSMIQRMGWRRSVADWGDDVSAGYYVGGSKLVQAIDKRWYSVQKLIVILPSHKNQTECWV